MLTFMVQGIGYGFAAAMQPGPFQAYVLSQSLERGWKRALPAALAPLLSDGPIITLVLLVLSQVPFWLQRGLNLVGGLFILYLAWGGYQSWRASESPSDTMSREQGGGVLKAALMNLLSPGPYIFWSLVTGPILRAGWREGPSKAVGFLGGFYGAMVFSLAGLIIVFGVARQLGPKVSRTLLGISTMALAGLGGYQIWRAVAG